MKKIIIRPDRKSTFKALVSGFALRAELAPFSSFVLVARAADREAALVAGDEELAVDGEADPVAAYLADLAAQVLERLRLR